MLSRLISGLIFLFWIFIVIVYPMLISIYVVLPLFIGFSGLMFIKGLDEDNYLYIIFSFIYILNLELNLSLPLMLIVTSILFFYFFIKPKLTFLKLCPICINVATVIFVDVIYFIFLALYDFATEQSSINYDSLILFSVLYDLIAAVLIWSIKLYYYLWLAFGV